MDDLLLTPTLDYAPLDLPPCEGDDDEPAELIINLCLRSHISSPCDFMLLKSIQPETMTETMRYMGLHVAQQAMKEIDNVVTSSSQSIDLVEIPSKESMSLINRYLIQCRKELPSQAEVLKNLHARYQSVYQLKCPDCHFTGRTVVDWLAHRQQTHPTTATDSIVSAIINLKPLTGFNEMNLNQPILRFIGLSRFLVDQSDIRSYEIAQYAHTVMKQKHITHPYLCESCHIIYQSFADHHHHICK